MKNQQTKDLGSLCWMVSENQCFNRQHGKCLVGHSDVVNYFSFVYGWSAEYANSLLNLAVTHRLIKSYGQGDMSSGRTKDLCFCVTRLVLDEMFVSEQEAVECIHAIIDKKVG